MTPIAPSLVLVLATSAGGAPADAVRERYHGAHAGKMVPLLRRCASPP